MRVAVVGANGQLGSDLVPALEAAGHAVLPLDHASLEVTDEQAALRAVGEARPDAVVNCAAYNRVDDAEDRAAEAFSVNALGAFAVARAAAAAGALCVQIGTDYVFAGDEGAPYREDDEPRPVNVYGTSKLAGEHLVRIGCPDWAIVRVASVFGRVGARGKGGNFVETIIAAAKAGKPLRVVSDVRMSPTYTRDAARSLAVLIGARATGVFHVTNAGACTWHEFASTALALAGIGAEVAAVPASEYPTRARRPRDSSLAATRLPPGAAEPLRPWREALEAYLTEKGHRPA